MQRGGTKMQMPNGGEFVSEGVYQEIVPLQKIVTSADFKLDAALAWHRMHSKLHPDTFQVPLTGGYCYGEIVEIVGLDVGGTVFGHHFIAIKRQKSNAASKPRPFIAILEMWLLMTLNM